MNYKNQPAYILKLIQHMQLRNMSENTIEGYVYAMRRIHNHTGKHPNKLKLAEITVYLQGIISEGKYAFNTYKQNVCGIRYYYQNIKKQKWGIENIPYPKQKRQAIVILSKNEVIKILSSMKCPKIKLMVTIAYACGLRHSEVRALTINSIDTERMKLIIKNGKGKKAREVQLPVEILDRLRTFYKQYKNKIDPYFFLAQRRGSLLMSAL